MARRQETVSMIDMLQEFKELKSIDKDTMIVESRRLRRGRPRPRGVGAQPYSSRGDRRPERDRIPRRIQPDEREGKK